MNPRIPPILAVLLVAALLFAHPANADLFWIWGRHWMLLLGAGILFASVHVYRRTSLWPALGFWYFALSALLHSFVTYFIEIDQRYMLMLQTNSAMSLGIVCLSTFVVLNSRSAKKTWRLAMELSGWLVATGILFANSPSLRVPFLINPSIAGTFLGILVCSMPLYTGLVFLQAILFTKSSTALLCAIVGIGARSFFNWRSIPAAVPCLAVPLAYVAIPKLATGNGRWELWSTVFHWWREQGLFQWIGVGPGSTQVLVPLLQAERGLAASSASFFIYLHNDWLQILLETGVVGLVLALAIYVGAIAKTKHDGEWAGMLAAYGAAMLTSFPLHSPFLALFGFVLLGGAYGDD